MPTPQRSLCAWAQPPAPRTPERGGSRAARTLPGLCAGARWGVLSGLSTFLGTFAALGTFALAAPAASAVAAPVAAPVASSVSAAASGKNTAASPAAASATQRAGQTSAQTSGAAGGQVTPTAGQSLSQTSNQTSGQPGVQTATSVPLLGGSADQLGGYSGNVLEKVLRRFTPPAQMRGIVRVLVRVGADGRPLSCDDASLASQRAAGNSFAVRPLREGQLSPDAAAEDALVEAACRAVALSGSFGPAPYAMPAEIFLTLAAGPLPPDSGSAYATQVMERVRPHIHLPIRLGGPFEATVRVKVAADGRFEALEIVRSSGKAEVDAALVQAFAVPGVLPAPGQPRELELSFTLQGE